MENQKMTSFFFEVGKKFDSVHHNPYLAFSPILSGVTQVSVLVNYNSFLKVRARLSFNLVPACHTPID